MKYISLQYFIFYLFNIYVEKMAFKNSILFLKNLIKNFSLLLCVKVI